MMKETAYLLCLLPFSNATKVKCQLDFVLDSEAYVDEKNRRDGDKPTEATT